MTPLLDPLSAVSSGMNHWFCATASILRRANKSIGSFWYRLGLVIVLGLSVTGCGYTPVHGIKSHSTSNTHASVLGSITLSSVIEGKKTRDTRTAQRLRNELLDRLPTSGAPTKSLSVTVRRSVGNQTLQQNTSVTRKVLNLNATIALTNRQTGIAILETQVLSSASFNTPRDPYATLVAEQDAENRAARILAENIITQVSVFLGR